MLISVIIPIYKVEKYLSSCIESVLQQTYKELEVILVDDGSPDRCGEMADYYAEIDHRVRVIHKTNGGLSDARNTGIECATGDYVTFVDSDDMIFPHMIEHLAGLAADHYSEVAVCERIRCSEADTLADLKEKNTDYKTAEFTDDRLNAFFRTKWIRVTAWAKLYKRELFDDIRYPIGKYHEDVFTTYKLIAKSNKVVCSNYCGYIYRSNSAGIMNEPFSAKSLHLIEGKYEQYRFMQIKAPDLLDEAAAELVYACNVCVKKMAIAGYRDENIENEVKKLYRQYGPAYLKNSHVSFKGKLFTYSMMMNYDLAKRMISAAERMVHH